MALYECVVIIDPLQNDDDATALYEEIKKRFANDAKVELGAEDHWGRVQMAYPIKKRGEGNYYIFRFTAEDATKGPDFSEVTRFMRFNESILRHLVVKVPDSLLNEPIVKPDVFGRSEGAAPKSPGLPRPARGPAKPETKAEEGEESGEKGEAEAEKDDSAGENVEDESAEAKSADGEEPKADEETGTEPEKTDEEKADTEKADAEKADTEKADAAEKTDEEKTDGEKPSDDENEK